MGISIGDRVVPSLMVRDLDESLDFYVEKLGFDVTGRYPDVGEPVWAEVRRDGVVLQFFSAESAPEGLPPRPSLSGTLYIYPQSVLDLAAELRGHVLFEWGPEVMDYGQREFAVRDPDGYFLAFAESA
ncbi:VOC family protein [Pelagibius sp. Alg239-R121]|uniref:VOC family protein n=1 Tax=Pelagibius sp. Alg239-R121 TaxID=2993448 RepID=UPI0024A78961|nr:VOC family protein [Pelagibius sp. Alg239-R121]